MHSFTCCGETDLVSGTSEGLKLVRHSHLSCGPLDRREDGAGARQSDQPLCERAARSGLERHAELDGGAQKAANTPEEVRCEAKAATRSYRRSTFIEDIEDPEEWTAEKGGRRSRTNEESSAWSVSVFQSEPACASGEFKGTVIVRACANKDSESRRLPSSNCKCKSPSCSPGQSEKRRSLGASPTRKGSSRDLHSTPVPKAPHSYPVRRCF